MYFNGALEALVHKYTSRAGARRVVEWPRVLTIYSIEYDTRCTNICYILCVTYMLW